ncbi:hypothetical protein ACFQ3W_22065 [Paenibacillus puldeungensis]|uniref:Uncharacterized protein n=2 Tax=Paenibacillus puldeungensis TaxID=696536 RepID=A0ABW3S397_9BACL
MDNNNNHKPFSLPNDPHASKAHFDTEQKKMHTAGPPGLWREISNLLILVAIIAFIIVLVKIF